MQEEFGAAIVAAGPQEIVAGADPVALLQLAFRFIGQAVGEGAVGVVPAAEVTRLDLAGDGDDFAEFGAAIFSRAEKAGNLEPEFGVVLEEERFGSLVVGEERGLRGGGRGRRGRGEGGSGGEDLAVHGVLLL